MKPFRLLILILPLLLTACGLSDQQKADYASVQRSGVNSAVYDKMLHDDALSVYDIKALASARVSEGVILRYLRDHQTIYVLSSGDVQGLLKSGVSQSVVDYMLATPRYYGSPGYGYPGYGYGYPGVSVGFGYGPYGGPWGYPFGGGYGYGYRHWR